MGIDCEEHWRHVLDDYDDALISWRELDQTARPKHEALRAQLLAALAPDPDGPHAYLSTGCLHGQHGYCASMTGLSGAKRPASCKFCGAACVCPCGHDTPTTEGDRS